MKQPFDLNVRTAWKWPSLNPLYEEVYGIEIKNLDWKGDHEGEQRKGKSKNATETYEDCDPNGQCC